MSILNKTNYDYDYCGTTSLGIDIISRAEDRRKRKAEQLEDVQNEYDLIETQTFNAYKSHISYLNLLFIDIRKVRTWCGCLKTGKAPDNDDANIDRRKKYEEKVSYELFSDKLKEYLGIDDINITSISEYNWGEAWIVYFNYLDKEWTLTIPIVNGVKLDSYKRYGASCFKLRIGFKNGCCDMFVGSTFDEKELAELMRREKDE